MPGHCITNCLVYKHYPRCWNVLEVIHAVRMISQTTRAAFRQRRYWARRGRKSSQQLWAYNPSCRNNNRNIPCRDHASPNAAPRDEKFSHPHPISKKKKKNKHFLNLATINVKCSDIAMKAIVGATILNQFYLHFCLTSSDYCHLMVATGNILQKTQKEKMILKWAAWGDRFTHLCCAAHIAQWSESEDITWKDLWTFFGYLPSKVTVAEFASTNLLRLAEGV
jgi:hypothetical protein